MTYLIDGSFEIRVVNIIGYVGIYKTWPPEILYTFEVLGDRRISCSPLSSSTLKGAHPTRINPFSLIQRIP